LKLAKGALPFTPSSSVSFLPKQRERARAVIAVPLQHYHHKITALSAHEQLTGEVIGDKWLLSDDSKESTSGKSDIYKAFRRDVNGNPQGDPVIIKISPNTEALERESQNYDIIGDNNKSTLFVELLDYLPEADPTTAKFQDKSAIVMERGIQDLRSFIQENGPLEGKQLQQTAENTARCVEAVHDSNMVWTEIKAENFVVAEDGTSVKGIDLESAVPVKENPIDYSVEAIPPEFAVAFLCGREPYMEMEQNFDVWSLGMLLYELATGTHYFEDKQDCKVQIATTLKNIEAVNLDNEHIDSQLKDLIQQCLTIEPEQRPKVQQVLEHPFFHRNIEANIRKIPIAQAKDDAVHALPKEATRDAHTTEVK
jgi:serine/threonine protein kinase